jgi:succinate dehydrogenase/fumarate reductase-like Fe-S protein
MTIYMRTACFSLPHTKELVVNRSSFQKKNKHKRSLIKNLYKEVKTHKKKTKTEHKRKNAKQKQFSEEKQT